MFTKTIEKYINFSFKYSIILIIIFAVLFSLGVIFAKNNFKVDSDLAAMFEGNNPNIINLNNVRERVGTFETFLIVSKAQSLEKNIEYMEVLKNRIEKLDTVRSAELKREMKYVEDHALLYVPLEELKDNAKKVQQQIAKYVKKAMAFDDSENVEKEEDGELQKSIESIRKKAQERKKSSDMSEYYTTDDGKYLAMKVRPTGNDTDAKNLINIVNSINKEIDAIQSNFPNIQAETGGDLLHKVKEVKSLNSDLIYTLVLCIVLLSFIIIWYFRSFLSLFIIMLPLSAGILSAVCLTINIVNIFNIVSAFSFVILYGLGIDFGIHLLSRYGEIKKKGKKPLEAMSETASAVFPSMLSGAITTAAAFFTLYFIDFKGFSDYGLVAVIGILASLLSYFLFFPVLVFILERVKPMKVKPREITVLENIYAFFSKHKKSVLAISILISILSIPAFLNIPFENDLKKLSFKAKKVEGSVVDEYEERIRAEKRDIRSRGRSGIYLTNSREEAALVTEKLRELKEKEGKDSRIVGFFSLSTFIPSQQNEKIRVIKKIKRLIERKINLLSDKDRKTIEEELMPFLSVTDPIEEEKLPAWISNMLREKNGDVGNFVLTLISGNYKDMRTVVDIKKKMGTIKTDKGDFTIAAPFLMLADVDDIVKKEVPLFALFTMITVILTLLIMFRKIRHAISLFIPLLAAVLWMFGTTFLLDIRFNLFNMVIVPTMIGTGIDSSIHLFHRFLKSGSKKSKIPEILRHTGGAVLFSSLTTFVGFFSLVFSAHQGMVSVGVIASLGIIMATIVNLTIFPLVMENCDKEK